MKVFLKKRLPILIFVPVLLIELVFLGKTAQKLSSGTVLPGSPDSEMAMELNSGWQSAVLGISTNAQLSSFVDKMLMGAIVVVIFGLAFLWLKFGSKDYYK